MTPTSATLAISASPEEVWDVVADLEAYTEWDSGVIEIDGTATPGGTVRMRMDVAPERMVRMTVTDVDEPERLELSGGLPLKLFTAYRTFEIEPTRKGSRITVTESFGGLLKAFIRTPPNLQASFDLYCTGLQKEVARRARHEP